MKLWLFLVLLLAIGGSFEWRAALANSFGVSLQELLSQTAIEKQKSPLTETQLELIREMANLYERDDDLEHQEEPLLARSGLGPPSGAEKNALKSIANLHLSNSLKLDRLAARLSQLVAEQRLKAARQS